ncbi:Ferredoxin-NADP reductase [Nocardioides terrae]|uniref:Ferredoxin-NADP reductase n=1 Tax=Nocardioides terrae TaxID=574651 RepID=A0A1I1JMU2_9ACTN|nr:FAD-binding oxidoreductase [Nocardioides terrae]SFC49501.1 Ferredoxin-NADP reductase [Nocardioides terrae]
MTGTPVQAPTGAWTTGTLVEIDRTDRLVRLRLDVADRVDHLPGQHYVLRLRADDDYTASRSYSVASDPADSLLELMVECLPGGEVSGFLHDEAREGDVFEVRGPIGGWFTWTGDVPIVCVGGGTGVVPFVAMLRHARRIGAERLIRVCAVGRTRAELPYADELLAAGAFVALTRENLDGRVSAPPYLDELEPLVAGAERAYVCGSVGFASYATRLLGEVGVRADSIRVEQFGATA